MPAVRARRSHSESTRSCSLERQRLPACKAALQRMPVANLVLAELPAEKDVRALGMTGGEVHEACCGVLHLDPELTQLVHKLENRPGPLERFCLKLSYSCWIEAAAVPGHALPNGVETLLETQRDAPRFDEPLDEGPHLRQRLVRLRGREVPHTLDRPS
jgi:hypothetical protein